MVAGLNREALVAAMQDARARTLGLIADLSDQQLMGPRLAIVNPLLWEAGHVAWFQEYWILRQALGRPPMHAQGDSLYNSSTVPHDTRWDLPLLSRQQTLEYLAETCERVIAAFREGKLMGEREYFVRLALAHEDMHDEAFLITRQTLAYSRPPILAEVPVPQGRVWGDADARGGRFLIGAVAGEEPFIHDNEKWAHLIDLPPFSIARGTVTQSEFAEFVSAGGYRERSYWSDAGWRWRAAAGAEQPVYWRRTDQGWERRDFDRWKALEPEHPVIHVNWHEAQAYCRFAGRRLPSEAQWEYAASSSGSATSRRRALPWGDQPALAGRANLDWRWGGCIPAGALEAGDSAVGCRQMIGNVWEWTDSDFAPYPGFSADPYVDYSQPWFGTHRVLRGGCWATMSRLIRNTWRNFYTPDRRDVFAGFRTCAL